MVVEGGLREGEARRREYLVGEFVGCAEGGVECWGDTDFRLIDAILLKAWRAIVKKWYMYSILFDMLVKVREVGMEKLSHDK